MSPSAILKKMKKFMSGIVFLLLLVSLLASSVDIRPVKTLDATTTIRVNPESTNVTVGDTFSLNITFENIDPIPGAAGFEFNLSWDPSFLQGVSMEEVEFHAATPQAEWWNILQYKRDVTNSCAFYAYTWFDLDLAIAQDTRPSRAVGP